MNCIKKISSTEDLNSLLQNNENSIIVVTGKDCDHCHSAKQKFNDHCDMLNQKNIPIAECPLSTDACKQLWQNVKPDNIKSEEYGIPVSLHLTKKNGKIGISNFILGYDPEKITEMANQIKENQRDFDDGFDHKNNPINSNNSVNIIKNIKNLIMGTKHATIMKKNTPFGGRICINCKKNDNIEKSLIEYMLF